MDKKAPNNCSGILDERFALMKTLGEGGNAKVKLAFDMVTGQQVAVKVMNLTDEDTKKMVLAEAETMSSVDHENVLKVVKYGFGEYRSNQVGKTKSLCYVALDLCQ